MEYASHLRKKLSQEIANLEAFLCEDKNPHNQSKSLELANQFNNLHLKTVSWKSQRDNYITSHETWWLKKTNKQKKQRITSIDECGKTGTLTHCCAAVREKFVSSSKC